MTPKEWAEKLISALDEARRTGYVHEHELTEVAFDEAIAAEREACAKVAEDFPTVVNGIRRHPSWVRSCLIS
jgi:hypothetical protein